MNEYTPEQLVKKVNELSERYRDKVGIKAKSCSNYRGSDDYGLSFDFSFELGEYNVKYELRRRNGTTWCELLSRFLTFDDSTSEDFLIEGEQKLQFKRGDSEYIWCVRINDVLYRSNHPQAYAIAEGWHQRVKDYLQQEIPEIVGLAFQKPAPRTPGLDKLLKEFEEK